MSDKTSDKRYRITLTENQLALVGTAVEGMMNDLISRKALCDYALNQKDKSVTPNDIMRFPSAQPEPIKINIDDFNKEDLERFKKELGNTPITVLPAQPKQTDCEYCHEDSDGYVRPLEKNCHAFVRYGINGWEISLKAKGWSGSAKIKYCPMCGRELKHG